MTCRKCRQLLTIFLCLESTTYPRMMSESAWLTELKSKSLRLSAARNGGSLASDVFHVGSELSIAVSCDVGVRTVDGVLAPRRGAGIADSVLGPTQSC